MLNLKVAQLQCKPTYHMLCILIQENRNTQLSLLFLDMMGLCCCAWAFSACGEQELFFTAVRRLLIAGTSPVSQHGLSGIWVLIAAACGLSSCGAGA